MGWVVAAIVTLLGAIGAFLGLRSKFIKSGYDLASDRQVTQAEMIHKEMARKDRAIDSKVSANRVKIKATTEERLSKNDGNAANKLIARILKPWRLRNK